VGAQSFCWATGGQDLRLLIIAVFCLLAACVCILLVRRPGSFRLRRPQQILRIIGPLGLALIAGALGLLLGTLHWSDLAYRGSALTDAGSDEFTLLVTGDPKSGSFSPSSEAEVLMDDGGRLPVRILWAEGVEPARPGFVCHVRASILPLSDRQEFLHQRGQALSLKVEALLDGAFPANLLGAIGAFREHNRELIASIEGDGSVLLRGVLLGDTTALESTSAQRVFNATGLAHLIAVSGSHLVVIAALLAWFLARLRIPRLPQILILLSVLALYVILTGLQFSAIRACLMTSAASLSWLFGRRNHAPSACTAAATAMLALNPPCAFSVGFWLSVFAVLGLTLFNGLIASWIRALFGKEQRAKPVHGSPYLKKLKRGVRDFMLDPLSMTLTAQAATTPLTAPLFANIPIISPLANILVAPLITIMVGVGMVLLWLGFLLGPLLLWLLKGLCLLGDQAIALAEVLTKVPYASIPASVEMLPCVVAALVLATVCYLVWPRATPRRSRLLLGIVCCLVVLSAFTLSISVSPRVVVMDVGQGDAILIRNGSHTVLVDTGERDDVLLRALARNHVSHIDAVVLTHLDADHCGALSALSAGMPVGSIYVAQGLLSAQGQTEGIQAARTILGSEPGELSLGDRIVLGDDLVLTVVSPRSPVFEGGNDESLCLALIYDENRDGCAEGSMLLSGDAESAELDEIINITGNQTFAILKIGHHGSRGAVTSSQLATMQTSVALISVGAGNRYGHPTDEILATLDEAGITTFRTDMNGDITVLFTTTGMRVLCDTMS
jgi:competence protein ComEC